MPRSLLATMVTAALLAFVVLSTLLLAAPFLASRFELLEQPRPEARFTTSTTIDASITVTIPSEVTPGEEIVGVPRHDRITRTT